MEHGVLATGVGKRFRRLDPNRARTLREWVLGGFRRLGRPETFWALREVSFQVRPGQMLGLIGRNGSGKTTLLRLAGGISRPEQGWIEARGRIGALIDVGAGYHPDLTGRENVLINGVITGLTQAEVKQRFNRIVEFAELQDFIDSPLRTYSTGMQMRLAFSVAVHIDPQILLIDEVLAVGDIAFQQKCLDRIADFRNQGCAIMLVSHDTGLVRRLCDEVLWLEHGQVAGRGAPREVVEAYLKAMSAETRLRTPRQKSPVRLADGTELVLNENRLGSQEMQIERVRMLDSQASQVSLLASGGGLEVEIAYHAPQPVENPIFGVAITTEDDQLLFETSTAAAGLLLPKIQGRGFLRLQITRLDLAPGRYFIDTAVYRRDWEYAYDYHWHAYPLTIEAAGPGKGLVLPPHRWEFQ